MTHAIRIAALGLMLLTAGAVTGQEAPPCPAELALLDYRATPNNAEYLDLVNTGTATVEIGGCTLVITQNHEGDILEALRLGGTLSAGDTLRIGSLGLPRVDHTVPDATLEDGVVHIVLTRTAEVVFGGNITDLPREDIMTSLLYAGEQLIGFYHREERMKSRYCAAYAGRLVPDAQGAGVCAAVGQ